MGEKKDKPKKDKTTISLPKAWQSVKHRNETAQGKRNFEDFHSLIGWIIVFVIVAFILLGGLSMTGAFKSLSKLGTSIGSKITGWIWGIGVDIDKDGVHIDPSGESGVSLEKTQEERDKEKELTPTTSITPTEEESGEESNEEEESSSSSSNTVGYSPPPERKLDNARPFI